MLKKLLSFFTFRWVVFIVVAVGGAIVSALFLRGGGSDRPGHIPPSGKTVDDVIENAEDEHEEITSHYDDLRDNNPYSD